MSYLYGDSTTTNLKSNFLEFLRDAVDFAVFLLEADTDIDNGKVRIRKNTEAMEAEIGRLQHFIRTITRAMREAEKGSPDSATAACATHVEKLVAEAERTSVSSMRARLTQYIANIDAEERATRAACFKALETLLAPHDPPDAGTVTRLVLREGGGYDAFVDGRAAFGLAWTFALAIPDGSLWSTAIRIERVAPNLEIRAPQLSGWISKEVKVRPQRLDRHVVTELVSEDRVVRMKLRAEPGVETGFDFTVDLQAKKVDARRTGAADGDGSIGPFDVVEEDGALIIALVENLTAGLAVATRRELTAATWRDGNFHEVPTFTEVVEKLVAMMAPIAREISNRSLKPTELVLRRMLANDRREEVFVEKATLREKYESLSPPLRAFFAPLGFDPPAPPQAAPPIAAVDSDEPEARAEIARSQRPPPPGRGSNRPDSASEPPLIEVLPLDGSTSEPPDSGSVVDIDLTTSEVSELSPSEPPASPPAATSNPPAEAAAKGSRPPSKAPSKTPSNAPSEETTPSAPHAASNPPRPPPPPTLASLAALASLPKPPATPALPADIPPAPESSQNPIAKLDKDGASKNVELIAALKKIVSLSRGGQIDDAYREYKALFSSAAFADYRPEDQRQALRLMVLAKAPPPKSDIVLDAYRAALTRLEALAKTLNEPVDLEMLGAAHMMLDDATEANAAFARALEIERARNPSSELIGRVMTRVASL